MLGGNMAVVNPYIFANRQGIPRLEATGVSVNTNNVVYSFKNHPFLNGNFAGLIIFKLPAFTAPTTAVPIVFDTNNKSVDVTTLNGANVTSAELNQSGIYLAFYDGTVLQLLTGI